MENSQKKSTEGSQKKANEGFRVTGNWDNQSKELKNKYKQLTDQDLKFEKGKENEMLKRVETRLNKNREEVMDIINKNQLKSA